MHIKTKNNSSYFEKNKIYRREIMTWSDIIEDYGGEAASGWLPSLLNTLEWVLWVALIIVAAAGAIYAIYVGVKMARAESSDQREEAKKRLINIIVAIVVTIALILFFNLLLPLILDATGVFESAFGTQEGEQTALATMLNTAKVMLRI